MEGLLSTPGIGGLDEVHFVSLAGEADAFAAPAAERDLERALARGARIVVVDLTDITFIDSTMLGVLVTTGRRLREDGGQLVVVCPDEHIRRLFAITRIAELVSVIPSIRALSPLASPTGARQHTHTRSPRSPAAA